MNTQSQSSVSIADIVKHVFSVILVISGIAGFYYFSVGHGDLEEVALLYRILALVFIFSLVSVMMLTTHLGRSVLAHFLARISLILIPV